MIDAFRENHTSAKRLKDPVLLIRTLILIGAFFILTPSNSIVAQVTRTISGVVTDANGEFIPGVSVILKGTSKATITNPNGSYSLQVPAQGDTLLFNFIGMKPVAADITGLTSFNVVLEADQVGLDEVVVVGYGVQKKETSTGAISTVKSGEIIRTPLSNVGNALNGLVAGISAVQYGGEPGNNESTLRIRGVSTLNEAGQDALVVIDGLQQDMSALNTMDPYEIESVSVLKDASATAIYGIRGANGVIIITTKRGKSGKPSISFTSNVGFTKAVSIFKPVNSYEYALFRNEALKSDGVTDTRLLFTEDELWKFQNNRDYTDAELAAMDLTPSQIEAAKASPALYYGSHDYFKEQYGKNAPQAQINLNVSGGNKDVDYFASVGYFKQDGIINYDYYNTDVNSHFDRYNFRSNVDIKSIKNLTISLDLSAKLNIESGVGSNGDKDNAVRYWDMNINMMENTPFVGPGIRDGKLVSGYVATENPLGQKGGKGSAPMNVLFNKSIGTYTTSNIISTLNLKYLLDNITKGLSISSTLSYDDLYKKGRQTNPKVPTYTAMRNPENPAEILYFGGEVKPDEVQDNVNNYKTRKYYVEGRINYQREFGKHNFTAVLIGNGQKMTNPGLLYKVPEGLMGIAARVTYNYREKYLTEFNMAYNGSENFPKGRRFGFFPSVSAGWVVSKEPFFENIEIISWLKFRASYGKVGNDKIGGERFLYLPNTWAIYGGSHILEGYYFGTTNGSAANPYYSGSYEDKIGNPDVTWETAIKRNFSVETRLFADRFSLTLELFNEDRKDILWDLGNVPQLVGAQLPKANIGKVHNEGYELELGWRHTVGKFGYYIKGSVAYAKNKVVYKDEAPYPYAWMNETGYSLNQFKGFKSDGFFNNGVEVNNRPMISVGGNKVLPGDLRYIDINGDGMLDAKDQVPIGYSNLPLYSFSSTVGCSYKGFDISILFTGSRGGSFSINSQTLNNPFFKENGIAFQWQYDGRWTPEKAEKGITPTYNRANFENSTKNNGASLSDFWLKSNDYIKLKNIEIGYSFQNLSNKLNVKKIRLSLTANNVWLIKSSLIDGIDPEQQDLNWATRGFLYPMTSAYMAGINMDF
jgi:TonB-linked SusC/RagA family outer membrane protein